MRTLPLHALPLREPTPGARSAFATDETGGTVAVPPEPHRGVASEHPMSADAARSAGARERSAAHRVVVDASVFPLAVVLKATYWMTGRLDVELRQSVDAREIYVLLRGIEGPLDSAAAAEAERRLRQDLIDFRTRALIEEETRTIRELLVAKAFDDGDAQGASQTPVTPQDT